MIKKIKYIFLIFFLIANFNENLKSQDIQAIAVIVNDEVISRYDVGNDSWTELKRETATTKGNGTSAPTDRYIFAAIHYNGNIYIYDVYIYLFI